MKRQSLKTIMAVLIGCMGLAACGGHEENPLHHVGEYNPTPTMYDEYSGDMWEDTTSTEDMEMTKKPEPVKVTKGIGNTAAALLKGGYFVGTKEVLYMADGPHLYRRDYEGNVKQIVYSNEGDIGYLNVCGDYIYYMTGVDRSSLGGARNDKTIYRKCLINEEVPELVASGVTDFGMGYGIKNGVLYCTKRERISPTKYEYNFCKVDLNELNVIETEKNTLFVAVEDRALYTVNADGEFVCKHWGGEYSLGNLGDVKEALGRLPKHNSTWSFTIEKDNFYYVDLVKYDSPCIIGVSPDGVEKIADLSSIGADYGTDLYAAEDEIFLNVGTISKQGYHGAKFIKTNIIGQMSECAEIEGSKLLYIFNYSWIIVYRGVGGIYWSNKLPTGFAPGGMGDSWGTLLESNKSGVEAFESPRGMGFSVN